MFWMLVAEVIVPFTIDHAYVVTPAGPLAVLPTELAQTCAGVGVIVGVGFGLTVNVAAVVGAVPHALVKTARYCLALSATVVTKVSVVLVSPGMLAKPEPLSTCHCTLGAGLPEAAAVKVTGKPAQSVCVTGFVVTAGAVVTVSVPVVCAVPCELVNVARYLLPLWLVFATKLNVPVVAPGMSVKIVPPSV
jgi:hypothetical protein